MLTFWLVILLVWFGLICVRLFQLNRSLYVFEIAFIVSFVFIDPCIIDWSQFAVTSIVSTYTGSVGRKPIMPLVIFGKWPRCFELIYLTLWVVITRKWAWTCILTVVGGHFRETVNAFLLKTWSFKLWPLSALFFKSGSFGLCLCGFRVKNGVTVRPVYRLCCQGP